MRRRIVFPLKKEGCFGHARAARLAAGIARGLEAIHREGILHRDLKPHNILVAPGDQPVIADFGVARSLAAARKTMTGQFVGTPAYMAPEQRAGGPVDGRSDRFAFCVSLYEGLHGRRPFAQDGVPQAVDPGDTADGVPRWLAAIVARGCEIEPQRRHPSMSAVVAALERGRRRRSIAA